MVYEKVIVKGQEMNFDRLLLHKLRLIKKLQKKSYDVVFMVDGLEGSGKSTLGNAIAYFLSDGNMTEFNIAEGSQDAIKKLEKLDEEAPLVIDEGSLVFSSKDVMKREQRQLVKILNVIRQKRMILVIIAPSFFDINRYVSVDRARFLLHVYPDKDYNRGRFSYFGTKKKRILYAEGKKNYNSYKRPKANFFGRFEDFKPPFHEEYLKSKKRSLMVALHEDDKVTKVSAKQKEAIENEIIDGFRKNAPEITVKQIAKGFSVTDRTIYLRIKAYAKEKSEI